jgi:hypothetical protein
MSQSPSTSPAPFQKANWTPGSLKVLATAKRLASGGGIGPHHLLVALEVGDGIAAQTLRRLHISPSAALGHTAPTVLAPDGELYYEDFAADIRAVFPRVAIEETKSIGTWYLGSEHLLLLLARTGVPGVALPYDTIRQTILELNKTD